MMKLEANIFPKCVFTGKETVSDLQAIRDRFSYMETNLVAAPLGQFPVVTLGLTEFDNGMEYSTGVLESYEFIVTRRFKLHGEWHVGGANGEILNVYTFVTGFMTALDERIALLESQK
jgi:hypothetical protein